MQNVHHYLLCQNFIYVNKQSCGLLKCVDAHVPTLADLE